jgi:pimeloyl-ACP methyl ester carboxylesterase
MNPPASRNPFKHLRASDLRAAAQLATQATSGVTHIVEGVHQSVWSTLGVRGGPAPGQAGGLTGLVYRSVHGITRLVGRGIDTALGQLETLLEDGQTAQTSTPQREALIAALNGVMGDRLAQNKNPLATPMTLRYKGHALDVQALPGMQDLGPKVLLMIHGLCMNDLQWQTSHEGEVVDHGAAVAATLGYTPIYLRYNTGLHTSQNGHALAELLEQLSIQWPTPLENITVVAHSMGGLVMRSACYSAEQRGMKWPAHLQKIVFLGTPHHGAPLERAGNWLDVILGSTPYSAPFAKLGQLRSAGITDLRYGHVMDADWQGMDRFRRQADQRQPLPLPAGVACYTVAATTAAQPSKLADRLIGDGLVPLNSALGHHEKPGLKLGFLPSHQWIAYRMNHMQLLSSPAVTQQLLKWLRPD